MRSRPPGVTIACVIAVLLATLLLVAGAQRGSAQSIAEQTPAADAAQGHLYDLQRDEQLGGHTLARHVGRTDEQLAERLRREPNISAASTWSDEATARRTVAAAIEQFERRIETWASRHGGRPNLVLNYVQRNGPPLGRMLRRGQGVSQPCERALIVLRWLDRERRWIVLTSYPETRR